MQVIIIGGGASGLMASIMAARGGASVTVLEQNDSFGKKILATGNGKCNLTNRYQEPECYHSDAPEFPWRVIKAFPLDETLAFFNSIGICTKERNGGIYPYSEQAAAVRDVLWMEARNQKVKLKTREKVVSLEKDETGFLVGTDGYTYRADRVIVAAGGCASAVSGSSSDGYTLAESMGHRIIKPLPALVGLRGTGRYFSKWAGVRFDTAVTLYHNDKEVATDRGEVQFTDYGISGIPVFQLSRHVSRLSETGGRLIAVLDFMPDLSEEELITLLEARRENCQYKTLQESLIGLLPQKLIPILAGEVKYLTELARNMKRFPIIIKGVHSFKQAQVCTGGVDTEEIDPVTMESKLVPGLYFAGEVVDVDGICGGYNLQWAWSSAAAAAGACVKERQL